MRKLVRISRVCSVAYTNVRSSNFIALKIWKYFIRLHSDVNRYRRHVIVLFAYEKSELA
jgi:hypothetical protein